MPRLIKFKLLQQYYPQALLCLIFCIICAAIQASNGQEWASLYIHFVKQGEIWRLITGHLVHFDWMHYLMNMIGLCLAVTVFRDDMENRHWIGSFLFISLFSSLLMVFTYFNYQRYVGFSDIIHGWILLGAACIAHKEPKMAMAIYILFWAKIIEENMELTFFTSYGVSGEVAKESHIYGAVGGMLYALFFIDSVKQPIIKMIKTNETDKTKTH